MNGRVLLYCTQLLDTGGIENHILEFTEKMASSGTEIDIIIPNFKMESTGEARLKHNCTRIFLNNTNAGKWRWLWLTRVLLYLSKIKYTALYTNGQGESIRIVSKLVRYQHWVHHHHTSGDEGDLETWGNGYKKSLLEADRIIACSQSNARRIEAKIKRKVDVISCFSRKVNLPIKKTMKEKVHLGYYGRLIPEKGIDILCSLSQDPDCNHIDFHLWGKGEVYPSEFFQKFPFISYHGNFNTTEELKNVLEFLDGFLLISTHPEGLPISLLESMSAGLPWLATDRGGIPDIACDPGSTRVISHLSSYKEIKEAVLRFAADIAAGKISRVKQKELYNKFFCAEVLTSQWQSILT